MRGRRRPHGMLVRARPRGQVLGAQPQDREGARTSSRAARTSIGFDEAIQRVYFNIGSLRRAVLDQPPHRPARRRPGAAQLRPDAVRHRPVPARLRLVPGDRGPARRHQAFLPDRAAERPLAGARASLAGASSRSRSTPSIGHGAVERGRQVFAENCAALPFEPAGAVRDAPTSCATDPADPTLRLDWLGNDEVVPASEIGTYRRAFAALEPHAGPGVGRVRLARRARTAAADTLRPEVMKGGGRGYYRNISLLSAWAHAPFMHNNAIGPEICGKPERRRARLLLLALRRRGRASRWRTRRTAGRSIRASRAGTRSTRRRCRSC